MNRCRTAMVLAFSCASLTLCAQSQTGSGDSFFQPTDFVNQRIPKWLQFDGSFRVRYEDQDGINFTSSSDTHLLTQFWFGMKVQPTSWLSLFGQVQDSEMFFNGFLASKPPYENTWDLHQGWVQIGNENPPSLWK